MLDVAKYDNQRQEFVTQYPMQILTIFPNFELVLPLWSIISLKISSECLFNQENANTFLENFSHKFTCSFQGN